MTPAILLLFICFFMYFAETFSSHFEQCGVVPGQTLFESSGGPYDKVNQPTLSPNHLQDLPGFTRSFYGNYHAVIAPESRVFGSLQGWSRASIAFLISPAMGSHFSMYLAKMEGNSSSGLPAQDVERFVFVMDGEVVLSTDSVEAHRLSVNSYVYLPPNLKHLIRSLISATLVVYERRYQKFGNEVPKLVIGTTDLQQILETPGEVFVLRKLLPTSAEYDFNVHVMDFQPGEYLNVKEVHYNQHGLLMLEGRGIYRLGENWYPVQAGDAIWMAPFVPQWYGALGRTRTRYLLYKDANRDPLEVQ